MKITSYSYSPYYQSHRLANSNTNFGVLKKTQLTGMTLACACLFKAPLEKMNSKDDLEDWAYDELQERYKKIQHFQTPEAEALYPWRDYLKNDSNFIIDPCAALVIYSSMLRLAQKGKKPPPLEPSVIDKSIENINAELSKDPHFTFNFQNIYDKHLQKHILELSKYNEVDENGNGWLLIPAQMHDLAGFEENIKKLQNLSYKTWCTKNSNAPQYLAGGDFHIYFEKNEPQLAIRLYNGYIIEIQGKRNNHIIPFQYTDIIKKRIADQNLVVPERMKIEIKDAEQRKEKVEKIKSDLKTAIETNDIKAIFSYFKIGCSKEPLIFHLIKNFSNFITGKPPQEALYTIGEYKQPGYGIYFPDLGIKENKLLKKVKKVEGDLLFHNSGATSTGSIEKVGGTVSLCGSQIQDLGIIKHIGKHLILEEDTPITNTGEHLKTINGEDVKPNTPIGQLPRSQVIYR